MFSENLFFETPESRADRCLYFAVQIPQHFQSMIGHFSTLCIKRLILKRLLSQFDPPVVFPNMFSRERVKPCFFDF